MSFDKTVTIRVFTGLILGAIIGFIISYYRDVPVAPFVGALGGALFALGRSRKSK